MKDLKRGVKGTRYPQLREASTAAAGGHAAGYCGWAFLGLRQANYPQPAALRAAAVNRPPNQAKRW